MDLLKYWVSEMLASILWLSKQHHVLYTAWPCLQHLLDWSLQKTQSAKSLGKQSQAAQLCSVLCHCLCWSCLVVLSQCYLVWWEGMKSSSSNQYISYLTFLYDPSPINTWKTPYHYHLPHLPLQIPTSSTAWCITCISLPSTQLLKHWVIRVTASDNADLR